MPEVEIHNGQIIVDGIPEPSAPSGEPPRPAKPGREDDLTPDQIAGRMAQIISQGIDGKLLPMEIVNGLLTLRTEGGQKLVWTKWDVRQAFVLWSKKLEGESRA